jgi:hypothetical protein
MISLDTIEGLVLLGSMQLLVTAAFITHVVGMALRFRAIERTYRLRLASWAASTTAPEGTSR